VRGARFFYIIYLVFSGGGAPPPAPQVLNKGTHNPMSNATPGPFAHSIDAGHRRRSSHVGPVPTGLRDLKLWQEAVAIAAEALRALKHAGRRESSAVLQRIALAATAIPETIADGYSRAEALDQQRLFESARLNVATFETHLAIARQAGILPPDVVAQLLSRLNTVGRLLNGYLTYVERQNAERDDGVLRLSSATAAAPLRKSVDEVHCA
jgi:four helix bundle protein